MWSELQPLEVCLSVEVWGRQSTVQSPVRHGFTWPQIFIFLFEFCLKKFEHKASVRMSLPSSPQRRNEGHFVTYINVCISFGSTHDPRIGFQSDKIPIKIAVTVSRVSHVKIFQFEAPLEKCWLCWNIYILMLAQPKHAIPPAEITIWWFYDFESIRKSLVVLTSVKF